MRILLFGAGGQVGTELLRSLATVGSVVPVARTAIDSVPTLEVDLQDLPAVEECIRRQGPDVVVNAAAHTAVDRAESEPELAYRINAEAPRVMAAACAALAIPLVHLSTDYVFDGRSSEPYVESDPVAPTSVYGMSKLAGEEAIRGSGARHVILRTAWVYALHGRNFLRTMLRLAGERDELAVVDDQVGCPTPAWLIADGIAALVSRGDIAAETLHLVTSGRVSWCGFARAAFTAAHARGLLARVPQVRAITTAEYPTPARRPAFSVLANDAFQVRAGMRLPGWEEALATTFDRGISA